MLKAVLTLIGGIVIGFAVAHFVFGPVDWTGVREQTGEVGEPPQRRDVE